VRRRFPTWLIPIAVGLILPLMAWLAMPQPQASAQCGTRASSCKTCHETQGKYPVRTKGDWHTQHAFGDFCVFCHAGNVLATDKAKAHLGMAKPLDDVNASCAVCHDADCGARAEKYAQILGVTVGMGSGEPAAPRGAAPQLSFVPRMAGAGDQPSLLEQSPNPFAELSAPPGNEEPTDERSVNWGNVVLAALALALTFGGGGLIVWNERKIRLAQATGWEGLLRSRPELGELMPLLAQADSQTVKVVARTLTERGRN
jgi:hypothetical protein